MLMVKTYLDKSVISGLGVFAGEDIEKDALVWTYAKGFDQIFTQAQYDSFPAQARRHLDTYAFWEDDDRIIATMDNDKYTNHSDAPNTYMVSNGDIKAKTKIIKGTEITTNYAEFDKKWKSKLGMTA